MASIKTKFSVGLFMIMGVVLGVGLVIWLGVSNYLDKGLIYAAYFDESVQGLDKDSPVKYRGVTIGKVQEISVAPDGKLIQVLLKIERKTSSHKAPDKIIARLKSVGITGLMFIELDSRKEGLADLSPQINFASDYPVIATHPSDISMLFKSIDNVLAVVSSVDLKDMVENMVQTLNSANTAIKNAQVGKISEQLQNTLIAVNQLLVSDQWQAIMNSAAQAANRINAFSDSAGSAAARFDRTIAEIEQLVKKNAPVVDHAVNELDNSVQSIHRLVKGGDLLIEHTDQNLEGVNQELLGIMQRLSAASEALHQFSERIAAEPAQLFWGKPMPAKPMR